MAFIDMIYGFVVYMLKASLQGLYHHVNSFKHVHLHSNNKNTHMDCNETPSWTMQGKKIHAATIATTKIAKHTDF